MLTSGSGSTAGLVLTQLIQGLGGGIAACASQTAVQGSVSHQGKLKGICICDLEDSNQS